MASAYDQAVSALTPVAWWKLDEPSGSSSCADSSGNGATITVATASLGNTGPSLPGLPDTCAEGFQNNSPNFTFTASSQLMAAMQHHDFTYVAWAKDANITSGNDYIWCQFGLGSQGSGTGFAVEHWNTVFAVEDGSSSSYNPSSGPIGVPWFNSTYPDYSIWRQFVWVYNSSTQTFTCYVNAVNAGSYGTLAVDVSGTSGTLGINPYVESYTAWTGGSLSQVAVFNYQLSSSQVSGLYNAATGSLTGSVSLSTAASISATGASAHARSVSDSASASLSVAAHVAHQRSLAVTTTASSNAAAQIAHSRAVANSATSSLTVSSSVRHARSVATSATGALTLSASTSHARTANVSTSASAIVATAVYHARAVTASAASAVTLSGSTAHQRVTTLSSTAVVAVSGVVGGGGVAHTASANVTVSSLLAVSSATSHTRAVGLSASTVLSATRRVNYVRSVLLTTTAQLAAQALVVFPQAPTPDTLSQVGLGSTDWSGNRAAFGGLHTGTCTITMKDGASFLVQYSRADALTRIGAAPPSPSGQVWLSFDQADSTNPHHWAPPVVINVSNIATVQ